VAVRLPERHGGRSLQLFSVARFPLARARSARGDPRDARPAGRRHPQLLRRWNQGGAPHRDRSSHRRRPGGRHIQFLRRRDGRGSSSLHDRTRRLLAHRAAVDRRRPSDCHRLARCGRPCLDGHRPSLGARGIALGSIGHRRPSIDGSRHEDRRTADHGCPAPGRASARAQPWRSSHPQQHRRNARQQPQRFLAHGMSSRPARSTHPDRCVRRWSASLPVPARWPTSRHAPRPSGGDAPSRSVAL
jgi:hypothetical protein